MRALRWITAIAVGGTLLFATTASIPAKQAISSCKLLIIKPTDFACSGKVSGEWTWLTTSSHSCKATFSLAGLPSGSSSLVPTLYLNLKGETTKGGSAGNSGSVYVEYLGPLNKLYRSTLYLYNHFRPTTTFDSGGVGLDASGYSLVPRSSYLVLPGWKLTETLSLRIYSTNSSLQFAFRPDGLELCGIAH